MRQQGKEEENWRKMEKTGGQNGGGVALWSGLKEHRPGLKPS